MLAGKPDAMIVIDSERQIICATQTAAKLLGWGSQAGIGGSISVSEIWANIYDLDGQRIPVEEWPTNLALTAAQTVTRQAKIVYPNGKDGEVYISAAPVRAENGLYCRRHRRLCVATNPAVTRPEHRVTEKHSNVRPNRRGRKTYGDFRS